MDERRRIARRRCLIGARVVYNNRSSTLSCTIRNRSDDGCLLSFGENPYLPNQIEIVLDNRNTLMPARIVWRQDLNIGIVFPRGQFMQELEQESASAERMNSPARPGIPLH